MGIPSYFSHIIKKYRYILKQLNHTNKYHNLYFDSNSIIYDALHIVKFINKTQYEDEIITTVNKKIEEYIHLIKPTHCVYIAFDGVAPIAKLNQQKNRRYKSWINEQLINEKKNWDSLCITPGTEFMHKLTIGVKQYFSHNKFKNMQIIISGPDEPGEGEHKIFEYIRNNDFHINETSVVYGLDSDLIMLTLVHLSLCDKLYLFRETPEFIKSIDKTLNPNTLYALHIKELGKAINIELLDSNDDSTLEKSILDYILLCFFVGNDFIPHHPAINLRTNGLDILMKAYKESVPKNSYLTNGNIIHWKVLKQFIKQLESQEYNNIIENYNWKETLEEKAKKNKYSKKKEDLINLIPCLDRNVEKYINPYTNGWEKRFYHKMFHNDNISAICINYLTILEWNLKYYIHGCFDWTFAYKYNCAPLFKDVIKYIPYFNQELLSKKNLEIIHPYTQLAYVLPKNSLYLLPEYVKTYILDKYPYFYELNYDIQWAFCRYFWESHVCFPNLDIMRLNESIIHLKK